MTAILQDFSPETLAQAVEANAVQGCKAWSAWPLMEVHEEVSDQASRVWTISDAQSPIFNNVFSARFAPDRLEAEIEAALAPYKARHVPMFWWVGPASPGDLGRRLEAAGLVHTFQATGMAADLNALNEEPVAPAGLSGLSGLSIEEVTDAATFEAWSRVMTPVYEFSEAGARHWFEMHTSLGFGPQLPWRHFLATLDGAPVATSSLFLGAGVAGISNVATIPEVRRRGIGAEITLEPLRAARRLGYRIGTLFASDMGKGVYSRLGFQPYCKGDCYLGSFGAA